MKKIWIVVFSLILFAAAFFPRAYRLDFEGINPDEDTWHGRIDNFIAAVEEGNWFYSQQSLHPAVTFEWLTAGGRVFLGGDSFWQNHYAMVWPIVLATSLAVVGVYLLLLKLFDPLIALVSSLLIALDPFFIAHSRVAQMDALLASFMILSILMPLVYVKEKRWVWLVGSGILGGLAVLTKLPALFLIPYVALILFVRLWKERKLASLYDLRLTIYEFSVWCLVLTVTFVAVYPAMWVQPILTVKNLIYGLVGRGLTAEGEGVGTTFYLGKIVERSGVLFYPLVLALRSTPVSLVFGVMGAAWGVWEFVKKKHLFPLFLLLYSLFFLVQMTVVAKAGDRYLLPVFPALDILAGFGAVRAVGVIREFWKKATVLLFLLAAYYLLLAPLRSHYLTYYNPLFGGGKTAEGLMVVGWGEGLREAARYLNQKPSPKDLKVAAFYPDSLQPYFKGEAWDICSQGDGRADYAVLYVNMIQRRRCEEFVDKYYENSSPEKIINLNGINYVWIYEAY